MLLAGLGSVLLILAGVIAFLVVYICKARRNDRQELPTLQPEKNSSTSPVSSKMSNPVFTDRLRNPTAVAMGGIPTIAVEAARSRIPSPKVHPAPQPPIWPQPIASTRVKKLSWGDDKTDSGSTETLDNLDTMPRVTDNTNLTVYF
ncbi:hypothetical protein WA026_006704 [Henosepilachna vigintioctopunctata]|uniref:Uncharacterized protein n=1 Tax=Henosepilachna vigintioctopunctata TaxID=420089 RepID=A0AAW1UG42_9CUCU